LETTGSEGSRPALAGGLLSNGDISGGSQPRTGHDTDDRATLSVCPALPLIGGGRKRGVASRRRLT